MPGITTATRSVDPIFVVALQYELEGPGMNLWSVVHK